MEPLSRRRTTSSDNAAFTLVQQYTQHTRFATPHASNTKPIVSHPSSVLSSCYCEASIEDNHTRSPRKHTYLHGHIMIMTRNGLSFPQGSRASLLLAVCLLCAFTRTAGFVAFPPTPRSTRSTVIRGGGSTQVTTRLERSASYAGGDTSSPVNDIINRTPNARRAGSGVFSGFDNRKAAGTSDNRCGRRLGSRAGATGKNSQQRQDFSKLFATPEPEPVQGRPLVGLSRSFGAIAQRSCYSSLLLGMMTLMSTFSPLVAAESLGVCLLGRFAFWLKMRGEDVSVSVPAGFVAYASLFVVVGAMVFMNGLKGISNLCLPL